MINLINDALRQALNHLEDSEVKKAMNYSLLAGGKRVRPLLLLTTCVGCGIKAEKALSAAVALEMVHTYSLIHDDLPAMDDDQLRRGKNTCHIEFNESTAILAGDGLLTEAFSHLINSDLTENQKLNCVKILACCAGANGMILGQTRDIEAEKKPVDSLEALLAIHENKTGKLFSAALQMGCVVGDKMDCIKEMCRLGELLGIAFQIQDDILDVIKTSSELGKSNSDIINQKTTYVSLLGLQEAQVKMDEAYAEAYAILGSLPIHAFGIENLINEMKIRQK